MSPIANQLLSNNFNLPKKIPENDERYNVLLTIPIKEFDPTDNTVYVYLTINNEKDYFMVYINYKIQLQTLLYTDDNVVHFIEGTIFSIE
jgi:hypothetical protein